MSMDKTPILSEVSRGILLLSAVVALFFGAFVLPLTLRVVGSYPTDPSGDFGLLIPFGIYLLTLPPLALLSLVVLLRNSGALTARWVATGLAAPLLAVGYWFWITGL